MNLFHMINLMTEKKLILNFRVNMYMVITYVFLKTIFLLIKLMIIKIIFKIYRLMSKLYTQIGKNKYKNRKRKKKKKK